MVIRKIDLPAGVTSLPEGVEIHGRQLRISFQLHGQRCREPLPGISKITKAAIIYADNKRRTILTEIKDGRFDYASHFPESTKAMAFSGHGGPNTQRTVAESVATWLEVCDAKKAKSTARNYKHKANHVLAYWCERKIGQIKKSEIEIFQAYLLKSGLSVKTVNDIFTVVRGIWDDAFHDGVIKTNPLDRIRNIERSDDADYADPFTLDELERMEKVETKRESDRAMFLFNCWTGLSVSELIAIAWEDVDTVNWTVSISRARVESEYKVPKERGRQRTVELIDPAIKWLKSQMPVSYALPPTEITVRQRDNITTKAESVRLVFFNEMNNESWHVASVARWFAYHLKRAGVRHRGPNQCRHTFASQTLSQYVPQEWVARQLGHADTTMLRKHYGRWMPNDSRSMAAMVSGLMGFRGEDTEGLEKANFAPISPQKQKSHS